MKKLILIFAGVMLFASACKKDKAVFTSGATIHVVNMAVDGPLVRVNPAADQSFIWSKATNTVAYGASNLYGTLIGDGRSLTAVNSTDSTKVLFSQVVNIQQKLNTLYLAGQSPAIEGFFVEESDVPFIQADVLKPDSSVYVRFVNLSPSNDPLNIKLTTGTDSEVSELAYKGITPFKKYPAKTTTPNYVFEVRDVATNTLRLSYTMNPNNVRHRTISLVLKGLITTPATTGTNAFGVTQVTYY